MSIESIAQRLVKLCREGKSDQAQQELYAADAVSIEPEGLPPGTLGHAKGLAAIAEKERQFKARIEAFHGSTWSEPVVAGNWFSAAVTLDATFKGRGRAKMEEVAVYRVRGGKIVQEQFFYDVG